jgi:hypothetical protein
VEILLHG